MTDHEEPKQEEVELKSQSLSAVVGFVFIESGKAIFGFIVCWFFQPVWERLVAWWKKR